MVLYLGSTVLSLCYTSMGVNAWKQQSADAAAEQSVCIILFNVSPGFSGFPSLLSSSTSSLSL